MPVFVTNILPEAPGLDPMALAQTYANSSYLAALVMGILVVAAFCADTVGRALKAYRAELWSVRRRPNVFDDQQTASPLGAVILALIFIIYGGIVLYNLHGVPATPTFAGAIASMGMLAAYYMFQRCAYWLVGYTFAGADGRKRWLGGFSATQAYIGLALIVPALLMIFRPQWHDFLIIVSLSIYFIGRILFIVKGFRIFYQKIWSLLYFILYLCTLEILPILIIYRLSAMLLANI